MVFLVEDIAAGWTELKGEGRKLRMLELGQNARTRGQEAESPRWGLGKSRVVLKGYCHRRISTKHNGGSLASRTSASKCAGRSMYQCTGKHSLLYDRGNSPLCMLPPMAWACALWPDCSISLSWDMFFDIWLPWLQLSRVNDTCCLPRRSQIHSKTVFWP